jgi:DNA-binding CsgD family transcriptional regulator
LASVREERAAAADIVLIERLHEHLPLRLLVTSARTTAILHANEAILAFIGEGLTLDGLIGSHIEDHVPGFRELGFAAVLEEVAASGESRHLSQFRYDGFVRGPTWWSWSLYRLDTDRWGRVVISLAVELTDQVAARRMLEIQLTRRHVLEQAIAAVPGPSLADSLAEVAQALVPALSIELCAIRLLDRHGDLHLVAAAGLPPSELRQIALEPLSLEQVRASAARVEEPTFVASFGLRWIALSWLYARDVPTGILVVASRSNRHPSDEQLELLDAVATRLSGKLGGAERGREFLRALSLDLGRRAGQASGTVSEPLSTLTPRQRKILDLYSEGLGTEQISELLVVSPHTVRTHVKLALRRLGVNSRQEALRVLADAARRPRLL